VYDLQLKTTFVMKPQFPVLWNSFNATGLLCIWPTLQFSWPSCDNINSHIDTTITQFSY
jgi:hypothetical protein